MSRPFQLAILLLLIPTHSAAVRPPHYRGLDLATFGGSGQNAVQYTATDSRGNIYVAGATTSPDFPVKNAAQPAFGESRIMRTTDLGTTWTRVGTPPQDVTVVVPDPVAPQVLFAGGDPGIYKSVDGGVSWRLVYEFHSVYQFSGALAIDPANHLRLAAVVPFTGRVIRSVDAGESWTDGGLACSTSNCSGQLQVDPTGSGALLGITSFNGLYISRDWGTTFQQLRPLGNGGPTAAAFDPSHPGWIYAGTAAGVSGNLSLSTDFGATWVGKASPPDIFSAIFGLAVDPDQPDTLVTATPDGLFLSTDGAASWVRRGPSSGSFLPQSRLPFAILSHRCAPAGGFFALGSGPGSYQAAYSPDYGATWKTPQITGVTSLTAAGCTVYVTRTATSDAFVAKIAPDGTQLWATYLGGSDQDTPIGLAVDSQDNVYLTGNTTSPDFPSTVPRIGVPGRSSVFVAKLSADGKLEYSVVVSGEASTTAAAIAVDPNGNAYVAGATNSAQFPITPGTLVTGLAPGTSTGFLLKLSSDASPVYATYLGEMYTFPGVILVDGEEPIVAGFSSVGTAFVMRLDRAASRTVTSISLPGFGRPTALTADASGNLFLAGNAGFGTDFVTPGAYVAPVPLALCPTNFPTGGDVFISKLAAADWKPVYSALLRSPCGIQPGALAVDTAGAAVLALSTGGGLPLRHPILAGPACSTNSSAIAKLSPDGSTLEFATYLEHCGIPGIAPGPDASIYAGVSPRQPDTSAGVMRLDTAGASAVSLDGISNAFSGDAKAVVPGGLYTLTGSGFQSPAIDLGLSPAQDLPTQLGGIEVRFDGVAAAIQQTGPGKVIVVPPAVPPAELGNRRRDDTIPGFTAVQVIAQGVASDVVWMPTATSIPGLLTAAFLNPQPPAGSDAYARNADGSVNDADHPAAAGSTLTLFATGMGATNPQVASGSVAHSASIVPVTPVYVSWKRSPGQVPAEIVTSLPGYLAAVFQIPIQVPSPVENVGGTILGNGVRRVLVSLQFQVAPSTNIPPASNVVAVYLK